MTRRIITVCGTPMRLYAPPREPHQFPWTSFADLLRVTEFAPEMTSFWAERWRRLHPTL